jgi:hypothetical protein
MGSLLMERLQFIKGIDPVADAFTGTVSTDVVDMAAFERVVFLFYGGVGATGDSTVTIEACDDTTPSNTTAVAYYSREDHAGDEGAITVRAAAGFIPTAGSSRIAAFEVTQQQLAATGYRYVRATFVEDTDSPVLGCVAILGEARDPAAQKSSAID